uniref:Tigger transposable element-derived protein 6 n=1 Tax=Heterorhabditis bacteriophora TaxID=37862 RepID=A0A1I7XRC7_HETBA
MDAARVERKYHRYEICFVLLLRNKNDPFLDRIVIYDKNRFHMTTNGVLSSCWSELEHQELQRSCPALVNQKGPILLDEKPHIS